MKKQDYAKLLTVYTGAASVLVEDLEDTPYGDIDIGLNSQIKAKKYEQREALSVLSGIIADEIGGPELDLFDEEDRNIIYDSEKLKVSKPSNYILEFDGNPLKIGEQSRKKWEVLQRLSDGESFRQAVTQIYLGNSPLSSQNMAAWEDEVINEEGKLPEEYRPELREALYALEESGDIQIHQETEGIDFEALRSPYARPGIISAVKDNQDNHFDSKSLESRRSNWKIGQLLGDLERADVIESRGSKYFISRKEALDSLEDHVKNLYTQEILEAAEETGTEPEIGRDLKVSERNSGEKHLTQNFEDDYRPELIELLRTLGALEQDSRRLLADDEDLEIIEEVLTEKRE